MKKQILVVGDLMLDRRRYGASVRTSPEDPRCKVLNWQHTVEELGGAGNVARWLAACEDVEVCFITHIGNDESGRIASNLCQQARIELNPLLTNDTTLKERICQVHGGTIEQLVRVDRDTTAELSQKDLWRARGFISRTIWDGIVVADYGKGVFNGVYGEQLRQYISTAKDIPTIVNAKDPSRWSDLCLKYLICNDKEALKTWGPLSDDEIVQKCLARYFVRTRGDNGVSMRGKNGRSWKRETMAKQVVDVTGAGDAFTAGFAHSLVTQGGLHPDDDQWRALIRGSQWAARCCEQIGCGKPLGLTHREEEETMGTMVAGWSPVAGLVYNGQPIYRNVNDGALAFENLNANGRLMELPADVEETIRIQL